MIKILITRPRSQAASFAEILTKAGLNPIFFPVIEIQAIENNIRLQRALRKLSCYDWVIFTSVNGVYVVWEALNKLQIDNPLPSVKVAAIGPKTAQALQERGIATSFVPDEYVAEAIVPGLGDLCGAWVLLARADIARKALPDAIVQAGGLVHDIAVYRTLPVEPDPHGLRALQDGLDIVTLTSPSTVLNFIAIVRNAGLDPHNLPGNPTFACIGPITAQAARREGLPNLVVAKEYTTQGLSNLIQSLNTR